MYATPLIEQGSVILGGTQQEFGFALRQQYFHKSVMLLLQHDDGFTKGIILNRPSAITLDGWRLWFGGDVAQGGLFRRAAHNNQQGAAHMDVDVDSGAPATEPEIEELSSPTMAAARSARGASDLAPLSVGAGAGTAASSASSASALVLTPPRSPSGTAGRKTATTALISARHWDGAKDARSVRVFSRGGISCSRV